MIGQKSFEGNLGEDGVEILGVVYKVWMLTDHATTAVVVFCYRWRSRWHVREDRSRLLYSGLLKRVPLVEERKKKKRPATVVQQRQTE